ncbi:hypothetical protein D3C79_892470 [compost metagenome]
MHYSPRLKINFTLDPKFKETATKIIYPQKSFMLDGHEVVLSQVEMSPLMIRIRVALQNAEENQWEVRQKIFEASLRADIVSKTENGTLELPMLSGIGTEDGFEKLFGSNLLDDPQSLVLVLKTKTGQDEAEIHIDLLKSFP